MKALLFRPPVLGAIAAVFTLSLFGQTPDAMPKRGVYPNGYYSVDKLEAINKVNGNITYRFPITALPPGRGGFSVPLDLIYNSQIWDLAYTSIPSGDPPGSNITLTQLTASQWGGWRYGYEYSLVLETPPPPVSCSTDPGAYAFKLSIITPDGSKHALKLYGRGDNHGDSFYQYDPGGRASGCLANQTPIAGPLTYYTADNSYIKLVFPVAGGANWLNSAWTAYFADGTSASGIGTDNNSITDRHGNTVHVAKLTAWSTPTVVLSDDFQHTITMTYSSGTNTITQAGPAGSQLTWTVNYMSIPLNATYFCSTSQTQCTVSSSSGVASIQVPSPGAGPLTYSMTYNDSSVGGWGELRSVQLPSGAKVTYDYAYENGTGPAQRGPDRFNLLNNPVVKKAVDWTDESDGGAAARHEVTTYGYSYIGTAPSCSGCQTTVTTNPDGGSFTTNYYDPRVPSPLAGLVFQEKRPSGGTIERQWYQNRPFGSSASNTDEANAYIAAEVKSVATSGAATKASVSTYTYDKNGNQTGVLEYDFIPYSSVQHDGNGAISGFTGAALLATTNDTYSVTTSNAGTGTETINDDPNAYWNPASPALRSLLKRHVLTGAGPGVVSEYLYNATGDRVEDRRWDSKMAASQPASLDSSNSVITRRVFDGGNLTQITDPNGNVTQYNHDSENLYLHEMIQAANATTIARKFTFTADHATGLFTSVKDEGNCPDGDILYK